MKTSIAEEAMAVRSQDVAQILKRPDLRSDTVERAQAIDRVCHSLTARNKKLTVGNIVAALKDKYPQHKLSESSIRNNTSSGNAYRDVISAWKLYLAASHAQRAVVVPLDHIDDISDALLSQIKSERIRLHVFAMRTALRNARSQLQILQTVTPNKLVRHEREFMGSASERRQRSSILSEPEREALLAMLDPMELGISGLHWNSVGQLVGYSGEPVSRPCLRQAIDKALVVAND